MTEVIGWSSSIVLLATVITQIVKQLREKSGKGVSRWLFIGQTAASAGFTAYSWLVENWVFTVTNALLLLSAIFGWFITWHFKHKAPRPGQDSAEQRARGVTPTSPAT
jgi:MtN3 and saliva related transmembrane protein